MTKNRSFTEGGILGALLLFSLPILMALFLQAFYGAVDLYVVGRFAEAKDVSAVSVGSQIMQLITNLVSSFAMGATIYLGRAIGHGDAKKAGGIVGCAIVMFGIAGLALSALVPLLSGTLASLMNAPEEAFAATREYVFVCGLGSLLIVAYNLIGSIFRGIGDSVTPFVTVLIASIFNVAGDLFLVAGLGLGAKGAAIATAASQGISVLVSVAIIRKKKLPFEFGRDKLKIKKRIAGRIASYGAPIALQDFLVGLSFLVILAITNTLGLTASAGVGVAEKVCAFIMLVPAAFMQAMSAFVAQNDGAGKPERAVKGLKAAIGVSTLFGAAMFVSAFFFGGHLSAIFSKDPAIVAAAFDYLRAYAIDCLFTCFLFCFIGYFNGLGRTRFVMGQGIFAAFAIRIPFAYAMMRLTGRLFYIGLGIPCSTVVQILLCLMYYRRIGRRS